MKKILISTLPTFILAAILFAVSGVEAQAQGSCGTAVCPQNGKVVFVRGGDIYSSDASGGLTVNLTNNQADNNSPGFSPDGTKIVFTSYRNPSSEVFVMNVDGSNLIRLTNTTTYESAPSFSPDGTKIVFARQSAVNSILVMNADGTNQISLTSGFNAVDTPRFSPDGSKIVFTGRSSSSYSILYTMNADGSNIAALPGQPGGGDSSYPSYSPDGTKLLFRNINNQTFFSQIFLSNADGSNMTAIIQPQATFLPINTPAFSPDGTKIIYGEQYSLNPVGLRINQYVLDGGSRSVLIDNATSPAWQPLRPAVPVAGKTKFDFDGDGKSDYSVYRPSNNTWYIMRSTAGFTAFQFGLPTDILTPADFDGDGKTDVGVFRPSNGAWYYVRSSDGQFVGLQFGTNGDIPLPEDFDGDGKADINVFRPSSGVWYRLNSQNGQFAAIQWGQNGDRPHIADFDGDGKADVTVYRPNQTTVYWLESATQSIKGAQIGYYTSPIIFTPADYNSDGRTDISMFVVDTGIWYTPTSAVGIGPNPSDFKPTPADYNGDGRDDIAFFRPSDGHWIYRVAVQNPSPVIEFAFGQSGDIPIPGVYVN